MKRSLSGKAAPPRRRRGKAQGGPRRPTLPSTRPEIAGSVYREIKRTARPEDVNDVANAVGTAAAAMEEDDVPRAVELLEWAKGRASRSAAIREGLGVALYLHGDFEGAQRELQAYRRLSGRADQNHLLADAARALGRLDRVPELVEEMEQAHAAGALPLERLIEAVIVRAGMLADEDRGEEALALLDRAPLEEGGVTLAHARVWYAAGDIAERMGEAERAREYFGAAVLVEDDVLDAEARLAELEG